ncbi:MAG: hypothetical protein BWY43_00444 [candidate division WS2 bacterium ADurb.Bin280]|uniref:Uncharacterized protein n=1 Tax=candidate division WS2 bacterium ADurb.Bin280 TaxID=1852829 RepID=A0A1V5SEA9_9BACT|nr:MAG: hypothetical protein BWY43_00444 [candidate division WS2 bacterium ADurb.Bin280]
MESKLSAKNLKIVSSGIISFLSVCALVAFFLSIDRTTIVMVVSTLMLLASLYLIWFNEDSDAISLLIFFFSTTACFFLFSDFVVEEYLKAISIGGFALLSFVLTNYLLNLVRPFNNPEKIFYKIILSLIFTELFWVISFINASQISKGAITAVLFFNFHSITRDVLSQKIDGKRFAFLSLISILLLSIVFYRI